jgi:hypothetical protein
MEARTMLASESRLAVAVVAAPVAFCAALAASRIVYPYDTGQYEANAWAPGLLAAHFHNPYSEALATQPPYVAAAYGPVYYAVVGAGLRLFGEQFWFFRLVALAAALFSAWLVFRIAKRFTDDRLSGALGAGLLLAQYPMLSWAGVQRPDVLALALALAGLDLALRRADMPGHRWLPICSALALVAAALTRQTYVIPIVIVSLWYLLRRQYGALARFAATVCVVGGAVVIWLSATSDGGLLTSLVTRQRGAASSPSILSNQIKALAESPVTWLTVVLVLLGVAAFVRSRRDDPRAGGPDPAGRALALKLMFAYLVAATVLALAAASRAGSNINYFIEPLAVASLLIGLAGTQLLSLTSERRRIAAVGLVCIGGFVMLARQGHGELLRWQAKPYFSDLVANVHRIPAAAGPMYSDYPELVDKADRTSYVNDFVQYDGRSAELKQAYDRLMRSGSLTAIVRGDPSTPRGYVPVPTREPVPSGVYVAYLFARRDVAKFTSGR